ncbi:MAG: glycoside hydrolase [Actinobacteria bacterium]|nr:glycoside hydrolase [Actinomycetota bacterium]
MASTITTIKAGLAGASNFQYSGARKIARNSHGDIYVVYWRTDGVKNQVYVSVSTDGGANWTETLLSTDQTYSKDSPSIAIDSNDDVYVAWSYNTSKIQCIKYDYSAGTWGSIVQIGDVTSSMYNVCLAVASDDHVHAICFRAYGVGTIKHSQTADGNSTWSNFVNAYSGSTLDLPNEPAFCISPNGYLHVLFGVSYLKVNYVNSTDDGASWSAKTQLSNNSYNSMYSVSIAAGSNNEVYAVWVESRTVSDVWFNYTVSGVWQTAVKIANGIYRSRYPNILLDKNDHIYVAYSGYLLGQTSYEQIGWLVSTNGGVNWSAITFETSGNYIKYYPHLIWAYHPLYGSARPNRPAEGFMLAYLDTNGWALKLMVSSDLAWDSGVQIKEFADSGVGSDSYKNADGIYKFSESGLGTDLFKTIGAIMKYTDSGAGVDVYNKFMTKIFSDSGSGTDIFIKLRNVLYIDSGAGIEILKTDKVIVILDSGLASDASLANKVTTFAESCSGIDDFLLGGQMLFKDYGVGVDVFKVAYPYPRNLKRIIILIRDLK